MKESCKLINDFFRKTFPFLNLRKSTEYIYHSNSSTKAQLVVLLKYTALHFVVSAWPYKNIQKFKSFKPFTKLEILSRFRPTFVNSHSFLSTRIFRNLSFYLKTFIKCLHLVYYTIPAQNIVQFKYVYFFTLVNAG